jgi:hypothetical protein
VLIICGDINVNYLDKPKEKNELNDLLHSYNLDSIVQFPTRIANNSKTSIDNIFLDTTKLANFIISPFLNGLSDHDAQMLEIFINKLNCNKSNHKVKTIRKINEYSIKEFKDKLSEELWQNTFDNTNKDVNNMFNSFLNTYLQNFHSCFPKMKVYEKLSTNQWITKGIIISCKRKKDLFLLV